MIANFFNNTKPINSLIIFLLLAIFLFGSQLFENQEVENTFFYFEFFKKIGLYFTLLFLIGFIVSKNQLTKNNSFGMLFFALLLMLFSESINLNNVTYASFFLFLSYRRLYSIQDQLSIKEKVFDSSFWIGIATLFYNGSFLMLFLVYVSLIVSKKGTFKNVLIPIIGFGLPILWVLAVKYFLDISFIDKLTLSIAYSFNFINSFYISKTTIALMIIIALSCISILIITSRASYASNKAKALWQLLVFHFIIALGMLFFYPVKENMQFFILFFPASILMANYLEIIAKKWLKESMLVLFMVFIIIVNIIA